ncbi:MAG: CpsD/CapB family tyrosine-protein kinase [Chloroflexi bacterium]|jgi:capsular exopolysaccharide synthesis family protein|nr:CpsD/CapB family tyrosine-protein kinase [Chloroflexota bacterium]
MANDLALITLQEPLSPQSEAYRTLRINLQYASLDEALDTLLVTSVGPDEGKTTSLANLAVTLAQAEQRVIVVDCDLRRPQVHQLFGLPNDRGLTTAILDEQALQAPSLQHTGIENLRVLTSGPLPQRPADLLGSRRMATLIETLKEQADMVLFDAPPVMSATDAAMLATQVDAVLLVVSAGQTRREDSLLAIERLQKVKARIIGALLQNAPAIKASGY